MVLRFEDQKVPGPKLTNVFLLNFTLCMTMPQAAGKKMFLQSYITDAVLSFLVFWYRLSTKFERGRWLTNNNRPYFFFLSEVMRCYLMRPATRIVTMSHCYYRQLRLTKQSIKFLKGRVSCIVYMMHVGIDVVLKCNLAQAISFLNKVEVYPAPGDSNCRILFKKKHSEEFVREKP